MRLFLCITFSVFLFSCNEQVKREEKKVKGLSSEQLQKEIEAELSFYNMNDSVMMVDSIKLTTVIFFRNQYHTKPCWFKGAQLNEHGKNLLTLIDNCIYYGLIPDDYHHIKIKSELNLINQQPGIVNVSALVKADLLLSDAYYLMGAHVNKGRLSYDSLDLVSKVNFNKLSPHWDSLLKDGFDRNNMKAAIASLEPTHMGYRRLKYELALILNDTCRFNFDSIPFVTEKDSLKKISLIKANLIKQGFYDTLSLQSDSAKLSKAILSLQKKWFIQPDGKLGKYTKKALSYNREKVIKQICLAMEQWRWEEQHLPNRYVFINIPAFWLTVFESDTVVMQSAIIAGKPENQTPTLTSKINYMLIYPYWNVPTSIATKEILPAVKKDITYLERKNFEVIGKKNEVLDYKSLPWKNYNENYLPLRFRQRIGTENSLGIVKFNFNNMFGVYLHDTNSKHYFKTSNRAQSHGCMRLENYQQLSQFLIRDDSLHYTKDSLTKYFVTPVQKKISLKNPLPILIRYFTAEADSNGLKLYIDIYNKDEPILKMLYPSN